jgi:hypothetical protein
MNRFNLIVLISVCLFRYEGVAAQNSTRILYRAQQAITQVIVHDIFSPPVASRIYLYSSLGAYEALTAEKKMSISFQSVRHDFIAPDPEPYAGKVNVEVSAVYAMLTTASKLVFSDSMLLDSMRVIMKEFSNVRPEVYQASIAWGKKVAEAVMQWSKSDQYAETRKLRRYSLIKDKSSWIPTPPGYFQAVEPHWGKIRTVALDSLHHYKPIPAIGFGSGKESAFYQLAKEVYNKTKLLSREDSAIALFWDCNPFHLTVQGHVNFATKKLSPGGHWMSIAGIASSASGANFAYSVKAYLFTAIALFDAFISCWDEKYRSNVIRPESYINAYIDQSWRPLLQTPPFPEYTSGHSVISASAAVVLTALFGDQFRFIDVTEMPYGLPSRQFSSFRHAAQEAAISRFYGGIHYRNAIENGMVQGEKVGRKVLQVLSTLVVQQSSSDGRMIRMNNL